MVRSAVVLLALLILPGFAAAQQTSGTHTVVDGDTLWDLAQRYMGDPFGWRAIWEANRARIADPNLIVPGQELVIPDGQVMVTDVVVEGPPAPDEPAVPIPATTGGVPDPNRPTIFYRDTAAVRASVMLVDDLPYLAVPRDAVLSAPWLIPLEGEPIRDGRLLGPASSVQREGMLRTYERVRVAMARPARVGTLLQTFRVTRTIEDVGRVVEPTGVVSVTGLVEGGVVGVVTREFQRIAPGDLVRPLPAYSLSPGQYAEEVSGGSEAMVMGFATPAVLPDIGHVAFLDLGHEDGIAVGDEFRLYNRAVEGDTEGALQVVGVQAGMSAARILSMDDAVWQRGVVVRLSKKMR